MSLRNSVVKLLTLAGSITKGLGDDCDANPWPGVMVKQAAAGAPPGMELT